MRPSFFLYITGPVLPGKVSFYQKCSFFHIFQIYWLHLFVIIVLNEKDFFYQCLSFLQVLIQMIRRCDAFNVFLNTDPECGCGRIQQDLSIVAVPLPTPPKCCFCFLLAWFLIKSCTLSTKIWCWRTLIWYNAKYSSCIIHCNCAITI